MGTNMLLWFSYLHWGAFFWGYMLATIASRMGMCHLHGHFWMVKHRNWNRLGPNVPSFPGLGKCPNWTSPTYGDISKRYLKVRFQIPQTGFTHPWMDFNTIETTDQIRDMRSPPPTYGNLIAFLPMQAPWIIPTKKNHTVRLQRDSTQTQTCDTCKDKDSPNPGNVVKKSIIEDTYNMHLSSMFIDVLLIQTSSFTSKNASLIIPGTNR